MAASIEQWGKVWRIDSEAGDTMCASSMIKNRDDMRDATYVRVGDCSLIAAMIPDDATVQHACGRFRKAEEPSTQVCTRDVLRPTAASVLYSICGVS